MSDARAGGSIAGERGAREASGCESVMLLAARALIAEPCSIISIITAAASLPTGLFSAAQVRAIDRYAIDTLGIPGTNGPDPLESGMPAFSPGSDYSTLGNTEGWNPLARNDRTS